MFAACLDRNEECQISPTPPARGAAGVLGSTDGTGQGHG
jgi:hypothetical protein